MLATFALIGGSAATIALLLWLKRNRRYESAASVAAAYDAWTDDRLLERRWGALCRNVGVEPKQLEGVVASGIRGGAATWYFEETEDPVYPAYITRHNLSSGSFEKYVQELASHQFLATMTPRAKARTVALATHTAWVMQGCLAAVRAGTPERRWGDYILAGNWISPIGLDEL